MNPKNLIGPRKEQAYKNAGEAFEIITVLLKDRYKLDLKQPESFGIAQKSFAKNSKKLRVLLKDLFWDDTCNKLQ